MNRSPATSLYYSFLQLPASVNFLVQGAEGCIVLFVNEVTPGVLSGNLLTTSLWNLFATHVPCILLLLMTKSGIRGPVH